MANSTAVQRFLVTEHAPGTSAAIVRSFLWLKRRIEEQEQSGLLVLPDAESLDGATSEALGWRLAALLKEEGALPLGEGIEMRWTTFDELALPSACALAAIWPARRHLQALRYWPGQVLIAPRTSELHSAWQRMTGATNPAPENYLSHMEGAPPRGVATLPKDAPRT